MRNLVPGFGKKLKSLREAAGLSQAALAELAGYKQVFISKLESETGAPYFATAIALAQALGVTLPDLLPSDELPAVKKANRSLNELTDAELAALLGDGPASFGPGPDTVSPAEPLAAVSHQAAAIAAPSR